MGRGCLALQVPKDWAGALGLWQAIFFSCLISHTGAQEVPDLECQTDLDTEVFCHWDGLNTTSCTREFQLHVRDDDGNQWECVPEDRGTPESASRSCVCLLPGKVDPVAEYTFSLVTTRTNKSRKEAVFLRKIVKPRPLQNLTVTKSGRRSFILAWNKSYTPSWMLYNYEVFCQIQIATEGQKRLDQRNLTEQTERYEIFTDQLLPWKNYTARIRYKVVGWGTFWSEWSRPCWWFNDFGPEPGVQLWWRILLACCLVMGLVSAGYCCFARLKRQWWDQIPSPKIASDLGKKQPGPVLWQVLPGDEGKVPLCATSQDLLERQRSFMDPLSKEFPGQPDQAEVAPGKGKWEAVLALEVPSVEPSLTVCRPRAAEPAPNGAPRDEEEGPVSRNDALVDLFLDILGGGDSTGDAEIPKTVQEEPPPAGAPEPAVGGLCLLGKTPGRSLGGSSERGCWNGDVATSPWAASLVPQRRQQQGDSPSFSSSQYRILLFPQQLPSAPQRVVVTDGSGSQDEGQGGGRATTPQPSSYKSFSSLVGQPTVCFPQPWDHPLDFSGADPAQLPSSRPPCWEDAPSWNAPGIPCPSGSCLSGYRPFRSAPLDPGSLLRLGSPYKPLLEVLGSISPKEGPLEPPLRTEREAWQGGPWEVPLAGGALNQHVEEEEEEDAGREGAKQATGCFTPQVPTATW